MRIAITGTIGSGKSYCSALLREWGYVVLDCDEINRTLLANEEVQQHIVQLLEIPHFDKRLVADAIFSNPEKKQLLEEYLHPQILHVILSEDTDYYFVEVPLLFESGWEDYFDASIVVTCDDEVAKERLLMYRGIDETEANRRLQYQMPKEKKMQLADYTVENNSTLLEVQEQLKLILDDIARKTQD